VLLLYNAVRAAAGSTPMLHVLLLAARAQCCAHVHFLFLNVCYFSSEK
jgi:hypothetical protein